MEGARNRPHNPPISIVNQTPSDVKTQMNSSLNNQDHQLDRIAQQNARLQQAAEYLKQLVKIQEPESCLDRNSVRKQAEKLMVIANANEKGRVWNGNKEEPAQGIPQVQYEGDINADSSLNKILYSSREVNGNILESSRNRVSQEMKDAVAAYNQNRRVQTAMGMLMESTIRRLCPVFQSGEWKLSASDQGIPTPLRARNLNDNPSLC